MRMPDRIWVGFKMQSLDRVWGEDWSVVMDTAYVHGDIHAALEAENAELKAKLAECEKALDQAIDRANLELADVVNDKYYAELNQRLPVWDHRHPELAAHLRKQQSADVTFEERLNKMQTEIDTMRAELKAESQPKQTGWVPEDGELCLLWLDDGDIATWAWTERKNVHNVLTQGRLAPNTEKGRSWLEAQRDRAASQWRSDNEAFEVNEVTYYFSCLLRRVVNIVYSPAHRYPYPLHKTAESAETDRGWVMRLLEGRGW